MKRLIVEGDPGMRKDALIDYDGEELVAFQVTRNGDYHGPDEVQLWCVVGTEDEREVFDKQEYIPHFLEVDRVDAGAVDVIRKGSELNV
jgi:hypothetical protein